MKYCGYTLSELEVLDLTILDRKLLTTLRSEIMNVCRNLTEDSNDVLRFFSLRTRLGEELSRRDGF